MGDAVLSYQDAVKRYRAGKLSADSVIASANAVRTAMGMQPITDVSQLPELASSASVKLVTPASPVEVAQPPAAPAFVTPAPAPVPAIPLIDRQRLALQESVLYYTKHGWIVLSQTDTTAQLLKPKHFSFFWAIVWALLIIGIVIYILYYITKRETHLYLYVDDKCEVHKQFQY